MESLSVWSVSLGCPKNRVDTERALGSLGSPLKFVPSPRHARLVFINTCAFIEPAVRESVRAILDIAPQIKNLKNRPLVVVAGCLPGRYDTHELKKELPEVDLWLAPDKIQDWPEILRKKLHLNRHARPNRLLSTPPSYAWLKIGDGCLHKCSFCSIPAIRGSLASTPKKMLISEARTLLQKGVNELIVVAQDVTSWGRDFVSGEKDCFMDLIRSLAALDQLLWLRLLYIYPAAVDAAFLAEFKSIGKPLLPYFDIPFQHCSRDILQRMGRPFFTSPQAVIDRIRDAIPNAVLRTTIITGFPGETESSFMELVKFVEKARFNNLGVFVYQPEEGTRAAQMPDQIPLEVKEERRGIIMELQAKISQELLAENVGSQMDVLVDESLADEWPGLFKGRVWFQAPEIDGITYISGPNAAPGVMLQADIEDSGVYDLTALE